MEEKNVHHEEKLLKSRSGMIMLFVIFLLFIASAVLFVAGLIYSVALSMLSILIVIASIISLRGLKILRPNEAYVFTLFGKYYGTLKGEGFFFVNPFSVAINPSVEKTREVVTAASIATATSGKSQSQEQQIIRFNKKISLKSMTLNNDKQKINDFLGNPIIIGIVVIWRVTNTAKAVFNVDNYQEFLSIQCDSALRDVTRLYPYDISAADDQGDEKSLRGSSQEVAGKLKEEIQKRVDIAGLEIVEARITTLAYAPEIAAAMLQRQQASAIIDARKMIVDGAVGMVDMALKKLGEEDIVQLDDERKAAMVSNLLVVLCGNRDAQPIVNSGTIY
ncbi:MAG: SPFH domain-containing protein [Oscillospiraceae bacterium]|jgi:regulator of protease activity HflC (stomatin/prohibitin superfamily)|nr:SPFH domain-containing protein [Oscillospiraceae bacterium]